MKLFSEVSVNHHFRSLPSLRVPECWAFHKKDEVEKSGMVWFPDIQIHLYIYVNPEISMLGTVIKGCLCIFTPEEKAFLVAMILLKYSAYVLHFTTNLLSLMHLKPVKCFTNRKYITHAEPMRRLKLSAKMRSLVHPQWLHWVCFSELSAFHTDFHPNAAPPLGSGEPGKLPSRPLSLPHQPFLNHWPFLPQQRSRNWQLLLGAGVASW